ncbi:FkbM family methyltransferase [Gymnodinialimonas hymeniacidonis]|uniref:FkbM family methyltransferase n=1 Tax=Gymnodinialimonas hymeniacidonis TaxID=3126508 RepID=UPI0034C5C39B
MRNSLKKYYEVRPFFDGLRYLAAFSAASLLARAIRRRPHRFFQQSVGSIDRHIITEGYFEKGVLEVLKVLIATSGYNARMLDIGGNIGNHAVALAGLFEKVDTFEPHPVLFKVLEANLAINGVTHATAHNFGLGNENTEATLVESRIEHGLSKISERSALADDVFEFDSTDNRMTHQVAIRDANEVIADLGDFARTFVKIDVEGMEQEILEAMKPFIETNRPIVSFEWFTKHQPGLLDYAQNLDGYQLFGVVLHDTGRSKFLRALKILAQGRYYTFEALDSNSLEEVYPLAVLVPDEAASGLVAVSSEMVWS